MTATERDNIIKQGVAIRRNTYRGKDITKYFTGEETVNDRDLFGQISNGTFDDIYVGDYIISKNTDESGKQIVWLIADLDNYWNQGNPALTKHHATIIPSYALQNARMNPIASTAKGASQIPEAGEFGAYKGSEMYQVTLGKELKADENTVLGKYIYPDFQEHVLKYHNIVSSDMDGARSNQFGQDTGASSSFSWEERYLDLMSEVNVFGTTVASSSFFDIGLDNRQYAIFQLRPELINQEVSGISDTNTRRYTYWLKAVASSTDFVHVVNTGYPNHYGASNQVGVRPRFLID